MIVHMYIPTIQSGGLAIKRSRTEAARGRVRGGGWWIKMIKLLKFGKQKCVKAGSFSSIVQCVDRAQSSVIIDKRNATS